jgi:hypothetical protein
MVHVGLRYAFCPIPSSSERTAFIRVVLYLPYCTTHHTLNVSQIRPFIENVESLRKFCHRGTTRNSIPRGTTVTDFWFFGITHPAFTQLYLHYSFRRYIYIDAISAIWGNWQPTFVPVCCFIGQITFDYDSCGMQVQCYHFSRNSPTIGLSAPHSVLCITVFLLPHKLLDNSLPLQSAYNFVEKFVWDPIQSTYCSKLRGASFAPKNVRK